MAPQHEPYYYHGLIMLPAAYIPAAVVQAQLPQAQQAHVPMVQHIQQQFMCSVPGGYPYASLAYYPPPATMLLSTTWHRRLGHPEEDVLRRLESSNLISCNKSKPSALCHACQLGKHVKLPFYSSESSAKSIFEIIHSNIWTSPIPSESGIKYYAIFLDHFSHFVWVYPLHKKSDLFDNFVAFRAYVNKPFNVDIKALQCDHGGEYNNARFHDLFRQNGIQFWFSCPRTSQQNGKSERMIRTINNLIHLSTHYFFKLTYLHLIGWKLLIWQPTF
ncbi:ribonuclease H-like domain-containing protein [Tanacetum coccineum]